MERHHVIQPVFFDNIYKWERPEKEEEKPCLLIEDLEKRLVHLDNRIAKYEKHITVSGDGGLALSSFAEGVAGGNLYSLRNEKRYLGDLIAKVKERRETNSR